MKRLSVLMALDSFACGGTETHAISVAKSLQGQGADVVLAGDGGPLYDRFAGELSLRLLQYDEDAVDRLSRLMREAEVQVVHVHQTPSGLAAAAAAEALGIPVVTTVHGTYYPRGELLELVRRSAAVISVSKPLHAFLEKLGVASRVIPNGIDLRDFDVASGEHLRERLGIAKDALVVTYASRIAWGKATVCKTALRAVRDLRRTTYPNLEVIVAGDGPQLPEVRDLARRLEESIGQRFVHVAGQQTELSAFYAASDAVVGTGRVALEAMACGKAVLAVGNHGFFGWVEPAVYEQAWNCYFGDHASLRSCSLPVLTEALRKGLAGPVALRRIGSENRGWVSRSFDADRIGRRIAEVYESALRR
jgi:glycosyltransferase involved in cell wall biosynthesis